MAAHQCSFLLGRRRLVAGPQLLELGEIAVKRRGVDHQQPGRGVGGVAEGVRRAGGYEDEVGWTRVP